MHGRLKVKTTEEQQRAKQEERAKKLKLYTAATSRAFQKRKDGELDTELLEITSQVLQLNPDFYTFWNMRKETFLHFHQIRQQEELQKLYKNELDFLEMCLKVNPKSYGTWHHRCFVMGHMPEPNWSHELYLCNQFLQFDERNFHCWDYRRFVVKKSNVSPVDEFDFTTSKISSNFSNYSSWHYRSKLLPTIYPDPTQHSAVAHDIMETEFELVKNGLYTDPDDQSNWFYHRWLLGRKAPEQKVNFMHISRKCKNILVSLTKAIIITADCCVVCINGTKADVKWLNHYGKCTYSTLWIGELLGQEAETLEQEDQNIIVRLQLLQGENCLCHQELSLPPHEDDVCRQWTKQEAIARFQEDFSAADNETLRRELAAIRELQELESSNKWAILTLVLLMKAVDPVVYQEQIIQMLQQLQSIDTTRISYYCDLRSRFIVESKIEMLGSNRKLDLSGQGLTMMHHTELLPLLMELNLSSNSLSETPGFSFLHCLVHLNLAGNKLKSCRGLSRLPCLQSLDLSKNLLASVECLKPLQNCKNLTILTLADNPLCKDACASDKLCELLPGVICHLSCLLHS